MIQRLWIVGAGGHGRIVAEIARAMKQYHELFFIDDELYNTMILDIPCVSMFEAMHIVSCDDHFIVAIGNNKTRMRLIKQIYTTGHIIASLIHPSAVISPSASIDDGCVVCANAVIQSCAKISTGCIINTNSVVEHDVTLDSGVHISPQACLTGGVSVGSDSWIGANATIIQQHHVGHHCILGAGSVLTTDMPDYTLFVGVPALYKKTLSAD